MFPDLRGDFFPYADIFSEGRPAYWTGYFTTRPFYKALAREVETRLRGAEILFTVASNRGQRSAIGQFIDYGKLVKARRWLALFQHHDAITGTSKAAVMEDYGRKLLAALAAAVEVEGRSSAVILADGDRSWKRFRLLPAIQRPSYNHKSEKVRLEHSDSGGSASQTVILYNSNAHFRHEVIRLKVDWPFVRLVDSSGIEIRHQINPWNVSSSAELKQPEDSYELAFIAPLPPLSLTAFRIEREPRNNSSTLIFCSKCGGSESSAKEPFRFRPLEDADIQLENNNIKLLFDGQTGLLRSVTKKSTNKTTRCSMQFAAYPSTVSHSGAYLFQPDANSKEPYINVFQKQKPQILITSGSILSEVSVVYDGFVHKTIIFHGDRVLAEVIRMETFLDMGPPPKHRDREFFIRFKTDVRSGNATAEFYTDQNGFQMIRRKSLNNLGPEANYYPVTSAAYIQDHRQRLNLLVARSHGLTSLHPGWIELMIDRRTMIDDGRGIDEGVTDNVPTLTSFILILEDRHPGATDVVPKLSLLAHQVSLMLLYPASVFVVDSHDPSVVKSLSTARTLLLNQPLPCNIHLVGFRTLSKLETDLPSNSALLTLHNRGYDCSIPTSIPHCSPSQPDRPFHPPVEWTGLHLKAVEATTLTGLQSLGPVDLNSIRIPPMEIASFNVTFT
jgi:alpha-mannosidase